MPSFTSNYPFFKSGEAALLPTPVRTGAFAQYSGRGVVMAFLDSGFYLHPDLGDRVLLHVDASTNHIVEQRSIGAVNDFSWHGQMTSVIAAGDGRTSGGKYRGIANNSQLVLIRVTSPRGQIKEIDILRGLRWLIDTHRRLNVRVVNVSVGGDFVSDDPEHPLYQAVRKLTDEGVVVLVAAGNRGKDALVPPASAPTAITVGGIDDRNSLDRALWQPYRNDYGKSYDGTSKPEITAPAEWIASPILPGSVMAREAHWLAPLLHEESDNGAFSRLLKKGYRELGFTREQVKKAGDKFHQLIQQRIHVHKLIDAHHQHVDGTSVSTAIASSIVAQMLEANPRLTPQQVRTILTATAKPLAHVAPEKQGAGVIDAAAAVQRALSEPQT
jgi:serine protease AprX